MNKIAKVAVAGAVAMALAGTMSATPFKGLVATATADDSKSQPKPQVSAAAAKDLQEAQKDMQAQKWDDMLVALDKVKNNPKKNEYDEYVMNEFYISAYANKKQLDQAVGPLEAIIDSKYMAPDEQKKRVMQTAVVYYQLQKYDKAVQWGSRAIKDGYADDQVRQVVGQSYYLENDYKDAGQFEQGVVDEQVKAGTSPSEQTLELGLSSAVKLNDDAGEAHWLELLVTYHPTAEHWQNILDSLFRVKQSDRTLLQVYRLSADVGGLKRGSDYSEMAQLSLDAGSPGEAVSVLNKGMADNVFTDAGEKARAQKLLETAKKQAALDQPTLGKTETEATAASGGDRLVGVGRGYFGYGEYDKAAKDLSAGLAKGATKDAQDARLLLGIAQFKSGAKDDAVTTLQSVKGDPNLERLAHLWVIHIKAPAAT
jgi:tetratricopeptide (TPR) repeat protein